MEDKSIPTPEEAEETSALSDTESTEMTEAPESTSSDNINENEPAITASYDEIPLIDEYDPFDDVEETALESQITLFPDEAEEKEEEIDTLSSMLYDSDDDTVSDLSGEDDAAYRDFLKDYREIIALSLASKKKENEISIKEENAFLEYHVENYANTETEGGDESKITFASFKKSQKKHNKLAEESSDENMEWSEDITLEPTEYEELLPEGEDAETPYENEYEENPLGSINDDDDFQLSINFEGDDSSVTRASEDEPTEAKYDPENPRLIDSIFDFVELFAFTLVAVMLLTTFVVRHAIVSGPSMMNTLDDGDYLIISDLFYTPERGDIIVFEDYSTSLSNKAVVKRVIGIAGDTVEVKLVTENVVSPYYEVYLNGELLAEDYAYNAPGLSIPNTGVWEVSEGELFVMGDNRFNSKDSRADDVGTIDTDAVLGKVILRFYPFEKFGAVK